MKDDQLSRVFAALGDPIRRAIVAQLARVDEATVGELAAPLPISLQAVSKHLKVLEQAGLITRSHDAQRRPCRLNRAALDTSAAWLEIYRHETEERFSRLDRLLDTLKEQS